MVVSFKGILLIYTLSIWKICIQPRVQIVLLLLSSNKLLTGDNLAKRRHVDDMACLFCNETESVTHLFFDCCVASITWKLAAQILCCDLVLILNQWLNSGFVVKMILLRMFVLQLSYGVSEKCGMHFVFGRGWG